MAIDSHRNILTRLYLQKISSGTPGNPEVRSVWHKHPVTARHGRTCLHSNKNTPCERCVFQTSMPRSQTASRWEARVHPRCKNGSCEIIQWLFGPFGWEKGCMINRNPFCSGWTHFNHNEVTYERLCDGSVLEWWFQNLGTKSSDCLRYKIFCKLEISKRSMA